MQLIVKICEAAVPDGDIFAIKSYRFSLLIVCVL